jgi:2-phosphosulfolactate phosphatase
MNFNYTNLTNCGTATGTVIVIDVIRAFTNAAFAFSKGAKEIYPVGTVEEALQFKANFTGALACGEVGGMPPAGFDFGNSPTQTSTLDLSEKVIVQRTSAGTQGIIRSVNANIMLAASFVVASATVRYIRKLKPNSITFVLTGQRGIEIGDEDLACAEYLEALLKGNHPTRSYTERVFHSHDAEKHLDPDFPDFPLSDLDHCTNIDAFNFAMLVTRENGRHIMRAVQS